MPQAVALVLLAVSVFGIGGAKLAGYYSGTMAGFTTGNNSITADLDQRVSAAAERGNGGKEDRRSGPDSARRRRGRGERAE